MQLLPFRDEWAERVLLGLAGVWLKVTFLKEGEQVVEISWKQGLILVELVNFDEGLEDIWGRDVILGHYDIVLQLSNLLKEHLLDLDYEWLLEVLIAGSVLLPQVDELIVEMDEEWSVLSVQLLKNQADLQLGVHSRIELVYPQAPRNIPSDLKVDSVPLRVQVLATYTIR